MKLDTFIKKYGYRGPSILIRAARNKPELNKQVDEMLFDLEKMLLDNVYPEVVKRKIKARENLVMDNVNDTCIES